MSNNYIKLDKAPRICMQYPTCSACCIDLDSDGDSWLCPACGTAWPMSSDDGDDGDLYAEWSGEEPSGPTAALGGAWKWGSYVERLRSHGYFPNFVEKPRRPTDEELMGR